jgi:hypothetical protein
LRPHSGDFSFTDEFRLDHFGFTIPVRELLEIQIPIIECGYAFRFVLLNHFAQGLQRLFARRPSTESKL